MKKRLLLFAAAATMLTACVNTEDFKDLNIQQNSENDGGAIGFLPFSEKITKAENSNKDYTQQFLTYHNNFAVWGYKERAAAEQIFGTAVANGKSTVGTQVSVSKDDQNVIKYEYAPLRFWDKAAKNYDFYAAAPSRNDAADDAWKWTFNQGTIAANGHMGEGYFTIETNAFSLTGVNLQNSATNALINDFKGTNDIDLLIADRCVLPQNYYNVAQPSAVNLNFIHILSKLNITISTSLPAPIENQTDYYDVNLIGFEVLNIPCKGTFNENKANPGDNKKWIRWNLSTGTGTTTSISTGLTSSNAVDVPYTNTAAPAAVPANSKKYIVESLMIPQSIKYQRVALDGATHNLVPATTAVPYQSYSEYEAAKHNDVTRLTEAQYEALIKVDGSSKVFKTWDEFNENNPEGIDETAANEGDDCFNKRVKEASKIIEAPKVLAYVAPTEPCFHITYTIDGEEFEAYYNLAAAFLNKGNNATTGEGDNMIEEVATFNFYEGWQNTLNIIINPTAISFTADVAPWDDNTEVSYEIEKGNINPNN